MARAKKATVPTNILTVYLTDSTKVSEYPADAEASLLLAQHIVTHGYTDGDASRYTVYPPSQIRSVVGRTIVKEV